MTNTHTIACYLDERHDAAIRAALYHLATSMRDSGAELPVDEVLTDAGRLIPLTPDEIEGYADALGSDTWLCEASDGPEV